MTESDLKISLIDQENGEKEINLQPKKVTDIIRDVCELDFPSTVIESIQTLEAEVERCINSNYINENGKQFGGRGTFANITSANSERITLYGKGLNYRYILNLQDGQPRDIIHDQGRIKGAVTIDEAMREYANLLVLNKYIIEQYPPTQFNISDYIFPTHVIYLPELTNKVSEIVSAHSPELKTMYSVPYGIIVESVPAEERYTQDLEPQGEEREKLADFRNPEVVSQLATNIKWMLEAGIIYHPSNYHLQNIYRNPHAQSITADGGDMLHIQAIPEQTVVKDYFSDSTWTLNKQQQLRLILAASMSGNRFFSNWNGEKGDEWTLEDQEQASRAFLEVLVGTENVETYIECLTKEPAEITGKDPLNTKFLELADFLIEKYKSPVWDRTYDQLISLQQKYNNLFEISKMIDESDFEYSLVFLFGDYFPRNS